MSEGARKGKNFIVVCTSPDVCLTPLGPIPVPVPYQIVAHLDQATMPSHNVNFGGEPALLVDQSMVMKVEGNEAGVLGGIKSGHNKWIVEFDEGSSKVRVNGKRVLRHGDTCWMNGRNTRGKVICTDGMEPACKIKNGRPDPEVVSCHQNIREKGPDNVSITGIPRFVRCQKARSADDQLSTTVQKRIKALTGRSEPATGRLPTDSSPIRSSQKGNECQRRAATLGPTLRRFNRYREALPYARAAYDMNQLGDAPKPPSKAEPPSPSGPCLTRLPVNAAALCRALGLPEGTIPDEYLRNDSTGFRAALYRDESTGKLILVARDTQPTSLVDWQTNTRNGDGKDTNQYSSIRKLSKTLRDKNIAFDAAGYSKGGGMAQEAGLVNPSTNVFAFNSAGSPEAALQRTGNADFRSLESRTKAFNSQDDFLTYMNDTKDPRQQIENVKFLLRELEGENRRGFDPMLIDHRNPEQLDATRDSTFLKDRAMYFRELKDKIGRMEADLAAGRPVNAFPPVRAGCHETLPGGNRFSHQDGPSLAKLVRHQMQNVLQPMENSVTKDRKTLTAFLEHCG